MQNNLQGVQCSICLCSFCVCGSRESCVKPGGSIIHNWILNKLLEKIYIQRQPCRWLFQAVSITSQTPWLISQLRACTGASGDFPVVRWSFAGRDCTTFMCCAAYLFLLSHSLWLFKSFIYCRKNVLWRYLKLTPVKWNIRLIPLWSHISKHFWLGYIYPRRRPENQRSSHFYE